MRSICFRCRTGKCGFDRNTFFSRITFQKILLFLVWLPHSQPSLPNCILLHLPVLRLISLFCLYFFFYPTALNQWFLWALKRGFTDTNLTSLGFGESKSCLRTCRSLVTNRVELETFKLDFRFLGPFDQATCERYTCSTLPLQNLTRANFGFVTEPRRSRGQGPCWVVFALFLTVDGSCDYSTTSVSPASLPGVASWQTAGAPAQGGGPGKQSPEDLWEITGLVWSLNMSLGQVVPSTK